MYNFVLLFIGLFGLFWGADLLISGSKKIAQHLGISDFLIGLALVSIGTSIPEIAVSINGAIDNLKGIEASGIVIGNAIGSVLSQVSLIIGGLALFFTLKLSKKEVLTHGAFLLGGILLVFGLASDLYLSRFDGLFLISIYLVYYFFLWKEDKVFHPGRKKEINLSKNIALIVFGIAIVWVTSELVVDNGILIAETLGISQSVIGILLIGLGTGLPEISVGIVAHKNKAMNISLGNLLGSNLCDLLFSLGIGSTISGFVVEEKNIIFDLPALLIITTLMLFLFYKNKKINHPQGIILVSSFLIFAVLKIWLFF